METGMYCPECLTECVWISTTRPEYLWCVPCDVRYIREEALNHEEVQDEMMHRVESWEEPHYHDFICPSCKSTQRTILNRDLVLGERNPLSCSNCRDRLVLRVPYSAFTK